MNVCIKCKHAVAADGAALGSAAHRAFCSLRKDSVTEQPVACESRRFAKPADDECGPDGLLWEPNEPNDA